VGKPRSLVLRRGRDGSVRVLGDLPDEHEFSARWIARELATGLASVQLTVNTTNGPVVYDLTGFSELDAVDGDGNPRLNFTGWKCRRNAEVEEV